MPNITWEQGISIELWYAEIISSCWLNLIVDENQPGSVKRGMKWRIPMSALNSETASEEIEAA